MTTLALLAAQAMLAKIVHLCIAVVTLMRVARKRFQMNPTAILVVFLSIFKPKLENRGHETTLQVV